MTSRAPVLLFLVACGTREPAHTEATVAPIDQPEPTMHITRPPTDRMGTMSVNGRLPPEIIQRVLKPVLPRAVACNPRATSTDESDAMMTLRFVIGRQGEMASVKLDSSNVPDEVVACVTAIFDSLSFPPPEGGIVTVVYPLFFKTP